MAMTSGDLFLGVDTGGTFTDLVLMDSQGAIATRKPPPHPALLRSA